MERQLSNYPRYQLSQVQEELRREKEARVAAETKYAKERDANFPLKQEINRLNAQATEHKTTTKWQEMKIS